MVATRRQRQSEPLPASKRNRGGTSTLYDFDADEELEDVTIKVVSQGNAGQQLRVTTRGGASVWGESDDEGASSSGESDDEGAESRATQHDRLLTAHARQLSGRVGLSEYEQRRLENIQRNFAKLRELEVPLAASTAPQATRRPATRRSATPKKPKVATTPKRQSLRTRGLDPDGQSLPPKELRETTTTVRVEREERREGVLTASAVLYGAADDGEDDGSEQAGAAFLNVLRRVAENSLARADGPVKSEGGGEPSSDSRAPVSLTTLLGSDVAAYAERLSLLRIPSYGNAKLCPDRTYSLAWHPSVSPLIVAAGDKWGRLGLWNIDATRERGLDDPSAVVTYVPHTRPLSYMFFHPGDPGKLYTQSYDGSVRCLDVERGIFDEVYFDGEGDLYCMDHDALGNVLALGDCSGNLCFVDIRAWRARDTSGSMAKLVASPSGVHAKKVNTVQIHPTDDNIVVTSSLGREACIWDRRKMRQPVHLYPHERSVQTARFSPSGSSLMTSAFDNLIRVWPDHKSDPNRVVRIRHNNNTGRWVTPFRPRWDPKNDHTFVTGSMARQVEFVSVIERRSAQFVMRLESEELTAIPALNDFHPRADVLASSTASGRVYFWTADA